MSKKYEESGVNLEAGYESVERIKKHVLRTNNLGVISSIGSFGGVFDLSKYNYKNPVLVSGTDGVGTKLKLAFDMNKHDTIGIDAVAMCVNDILAQGAKPLIFLDYLAVGKNYPEQIENIVKGVSDGCIQAGCALVGGETAEMPGFYKDGEYDIAGFSVGVCEKDELIDIEETREGLVAIAIPSSGFHSNGFSLIRKIITDNKLDLNDKFENTTLGEKLLTPTRIYVKEVLELMKSVKVYGVSHITGGGFQENLPRCIKSGLGFEINRSSYDVPSIFKYIQKVGNISDDEMYNVFNMGVGMVVLVDEKDVKTTLDIIKDSFVIGQVISGDGVKFI